MAPIGRYNYQIMQAILWGRISMKTIMNPQVISLDEAPQAYKDFSDGSSKKFIIDPWHDKKPFVNSRRAKIKSKGGTSNKCPTFFNFSA